ncbi:hypothetical protein [Streptomyces sp. V4I2]|uniref:hypothetical protein n=1 Tax=Streptomyces sp. V4I2 TaxID=3042280 RepID=UPI00277FEF47|nr:hypothetical protein [Streptomyces sp. V4I2]MDQ1049426.1 hypothetical protein [Streptomyces sp. V4I2]
MSRLSGQQVRLRRSSQAGASWAGVALCSLTAASKGAAGLGESTAGGSQAVQQVGGDVPVAQQQLGGTQMSE